MKKVRDSKYELLRIISMFMIVLGHVIGHGGVQDNVSGSLFVVVEMIKAFLIVHVDSFVLVTGYYQCKSDFKAAKLFSLNNAAWFYRVAIVVLLLAFNVISVGRLEILHNIVPIDLSVYWFIDIYLILYCMSPFLNILINKIDKSTHQKLLIAMLVIFSVLPSLTAQKSFFNSGGFSITNFILLYFIGAYFRNYPVNFFEFYKIYSNKVKRLIFGSMYVGITVFNLSLFLVGIYISDMGNVASSVSNTIKVMAFSYDNPLVIAAAVSYFLWFGCLSINSKIINKISSLTFGIYLIHDNPYVRAHVYQWLGLKLGVPIYSYMIIPKIFGIAIIIFIVCAAIELIRQFVFKFAYKLSVSGKVRQKYKNYVLEVSTRKPIDCTEAEA